MVSFGFFTQAIPAQETKEISWSRTFGGSGEDVGCDLVVCQSGGFAIGGYTYSFGAGMNDAWLIRVDAQGNLLWNQTYGKEYGESVFGLIECQDGGFALVGTTATYDIDHIDMWLVRTDSEGSLLWNQSYGGAKAEEGHSLVECSAGGFVLAGNTKGFGADTQDMWLVRITENGTLLWQRTFDGLGSWDYCFRVLECSAGGFIMIGYSIAGNNADYGVFLVRTDASGNKIWSKIFSGYPGVIPYYQRGFALIECQEGGFAILAQLLAPDRRHTDLRFIRIDNQGNQLWDHTYGGVEEERSYDLVETDDGGFMLLASVLNPEEPQWDALLFRTDENGTLLWESLVGTSNWEMGYALVKCPYTGFALAGYVRQFQSEEDVWLSWHPDAPLNILYSGYLERSLIVAVLFVIILAVMITSVYYLLKQNRKST